MEIFFDQPIKNNKLKTLEKLLLVKQMLIQLVAY